MAPREGGTVSDDKRHLEAAAIFDQLAATVDAIPRDVSRAFCQPDVNDGLLDVERTTEMLRDIGFGSFPQTAEHLVRSFIRIERCGADSSAYGCPLAFRRCGQQRQYRGDKARYAVSILLPSKPLDQICGPNESNL